jgi:hypothetical protein
METNIGKLKTLIANFGKCKITYNVDDLDYRFNGKNPYKIVTNHYQLALNDFYNLCAKQIKESKFDKPLINSILKNISSQLRENSKSQDQHRVNYLLDKSKNIISNECDSTHELIVSILNIQKSMFQQMLQFLESIIDEVDYIIEEDIKQMMAGYVDVETETLNIPELGQMIINLSKKDAINFITLLEHIDVISFKGTNRNKFIEANFKYNKKGLATEITKMNSDLANLHDNGRDMGPRNQKSMDNLIDGIITKLNNTDFKTYSNWLKDTI